MKAKFFLAAVLVLALSIGSAFAAPIKTEVNKAASVGSSNTTMPVHHWHHHRHHHHHHMMHH
jgi:hypothetical protein